MLRSRKTAVVILFGLTMSSMTFGAQYKPNEVIVKYKDVEARSRDSMDKFYTAYKVEEVRHYTGMLRSFDHLILGEGADLRQAIEELNRDDKVAYAQPNYLVHAFPTFEEEKNAAAPCLLPGINLPENCVSPFKGRRKPKPKPKQDERPELKEAPEDVYPLLKDPSLTRTYGLNTTGAIEAWKIHPGSKDFIVADIDTGIDYNHEDLAFNIWRNPNPSDSKDIAGYDFIHNDGLPFDDQGHGTHTAGTIGAVGGNGIGISGVAQRVSIMAVKFLDKNGSGTTADAIRAIDYAVSHRARVLSNSWGGPADEDNLALRDVIISAGKADVLFIAAAGNDGNDNDGRNADYPSGFNLENQISVAAVDSKDVLADFSNYGKQSVHLAAPGVRIYSTQPGNLYRSLSGTSMACPHVAGAAALLWSYHPEWDSQRVKKTLLDTVDPIAGLKDKTVTGGRVNVLKALESKSVRTVSSN